MPNLNLVCTARRAAARAIALVAAGACILIVCGCAKPESPDASSTTGAAVQSAAPRGSGEDRDAKDTADVHPPAAPGSGQGN